MSLHKLCVCSLFCYRIICHCLSAFPLGIPDPFIDKYLMGISEQRSIPWQVQTLYLQCLLIHLRTT